ncbi:MAG: signal recognition particle-docking protein FtsY [Clostridiales bacterium]|nr:signal recognition particle-docking protein FtsY [Clostridiales bacterium]
MGIFGKLFGALKKTKDNFSGKLRTLFSKNKLGDEFYEELEEILISSDVSVSTAEEVVERVKAKAIEGRLKDEEYVTNLLRDILTEILEESEVEPPSYPCVIMLVGVNGVGKTTTVGKLAHYYLSQGKTVTVAAADTFRAAASEQLSIWADRAKVRIVKHEEGSDPSAVIYDAVASAKAKGTDVVIVDTAGRLHVKDNLMNELRKMDRVVTREYPEADFLKLLVLDATTGQNAVNQARVFDEAVELDGIVLTKLDGTAKGGFVFSLSSELSLPVIYAGVGEKMEDLEAFDSKSFVEAIL